MACAMAAVRAVRRCGRASAVSRAARAASSRHAASAAAAPANPLLAGGDFPLYSQVRSEHVSGGIREALAASAAALESLEASAEPTWEGLAEPLERLNDAVTRPWQVVSHLKMTKDSPALREAHAEVEAEVVRHGLRVAGSKAIYDRFVELQADADAFAALSEAQRRAVEGEIRRASLAGVGLEGAGRDRFTAIEERLSALATEFSNNVLDATAAFAHVVEGKERVAGLPESTLELAAAAARDKSGVEGATAADGPWAFTLDMPQVLAVYKFAEDRELREAVYRGFVTRAGEQNLPVIEQILELRRERAALLGYANHAEVSLASKMADLATARDLLEKLRSSSYDAAAAELAEVRAFAASRGCGHELAHWDVPFWTERLKEHTFSLTDEELRPYLPLEGVLDGLFALTERLFGVKVTPADGEAEVWHEDVRFFRVADASSGEPLAYFYLDPYSRPAEKRGGAWMDDVQGRSAACAPSRGGVRLPVAHMVCNGTPPAGGKPSLMTFREVETLFHEMGHALQHMLTRVDHGLVSGINGVEWDAVELPSQFMENWCYDERTVAGFARHHETGEPLPRELFEKVLSARTYNAGSMMLRQVNFSLLDLELHTGDGSETCLEVQARVAEAGTSVMPLFEGDRFLCAFGHIFAGGYSAGYYSYKWAEVLSADAFAAFEEAGLGDEAAVEGTGRRFRETVLALGGGRAPLDVFKDFRGREPSTEPLLRHYGLAPAQ